MVSGHELTSSGNTTPPPRSASERAALSVLRCDRGRPAPSEELRRAIGVYARELRARGEPPERVLVAVKALLAEAGVRKPGFVSIPASPSAARDTALFDCAVASAIDAYFGRADRDA